MYIYVYIYIYVCVCVCVCGESVLALKVTVGLIQRSPHTYDRETGHTRVNPNPIYYT